MQGFWGRFLGLLLVAGAVTGVFVGAPVGFFATAFARPTEPSFITGFNQGWIRNHYGSQWTRDFDPAEFERLLRKTKANGGSVFRIWFFEGAEFAGVRWGEWTLDPVRLTNLKKFLALARAVDVKIYFTLFDGNISVDGSRRAEWQRLLHEDSGDASRFRERVLGPVLEILYAERELIFGIDLVNEINAFVLRGWFRGAWMGAQDFVAEWRSFIRGYPRMVGVPPIPVTASLGHVSVMSDLLNDRLAGVDFYDFHLYDDEGRIPRAEEVRAFVAERTQPVYLGEFGQRWRGFDDAIQSRALEGFLRNAKALGLAGAFPWRLSENYSGENPDARFSFEIGDPAVDRPALAKFRALTAEFSQ